MPSVTCEARLTCGVICDVGLSAVAAGLITPLAANGTPLLLMKEHCSALPLKHRLISSVWLSWVMMPLMPKPLLANAARLYSMLRRKSWSRTRKHDKFLTESE